MPLSNAERQARYRARVKEKLWAAEAGGAAPTARTPCLSPEEAAARRAFLADPPDASRRFMGLTRAEWIRAPEDLAAHFGLLEAIDGWRREGPGRKAPGEGRAASDEIPRWLRRGEPR